ncbi:unnamed protein product [Orchesella dallaii]|uniref:F-box domain-containing protein n=1 Tax=Orchesella dallaii TaxID=48710 RepID=A0ABP1QF17_9HEXA
MEETCIEVDQYPAKRKASSICEKNISLTATIGESDNHSSSPLMHFPKEIWSHIFNYVPQNDRLAHRVVNKEWCKNIDEFSTVDVNFNADYPQTKYRKRVFELRIRNCTFSSLHVPFSPDFKNPLLVKEITFTTHVSSSNVLKVLSVCSNVESLRFLTTMSSETSFKEDETTSNVFNNLKNLQYLEIGILTFLDRCPKTRSKTYSAIIGNDNVLLPSLKELRVAFLVLHIEWFQLFKFVSRHSVTLKSFNVMSPCGERIVGGEQRCKDTIVQKGLTFPQLDTLIVNGVSECACREDIWLLLDQQKQLKRCETDISQGALFLKEVIERNHKTIRVLKLHEISNLDSDELSCDMFRKCSSLQDLYLRFEWGFVIVVNVGGGTSKSRVPVLYNLESLPESLKRLTLCGSQLLSDELDSLFSKKRVLEEVTLGKAETLKAKNTGLTSKILTKMLENLEKLRKVRISIDMICEHECREGNYCGDLNGIWLKIWELAKEMDVVDNEIGDYEGRCCGPRYNEETCMSHQPFIDMVFKTDPLRVSFLNRLKELQSQDDAV